MTTNSNEYEYDYDTNFAPLAMFKASNVIPPLKQIAGREWVKLVVWKFLILIANEYLSKESPATKLVQDVIHKLETHGKLHPDIHTINSFNEILAELKPALKKIKDDELLKILELLDKVKDKIHQPELMGKDFLELMGKDFLELARLITNKQEKPSKNSSPNLEDYKELFKIIPLPSISKTFEDDLQFANMRVSGPNPLVIERMTEKDPQFPVTDEQYKSAMETSESLQQAIDDGRVYVADYKIFEGILQGSYPKEQKYICAPLAMFAVPEKGHKNYPYLCPIAIQCFQQPGPENPIFTPQDDDNWLIAKTIVQIADGNFHEAISHLGRTHLFMEPFVVATYRTLPENNPIRKLLQPHFEGTLFINWGAQHVLMARKGLVDQLLVPAINASCVAATQGAQSYLFNFYSSMLKKTLESRHVDDKEKLPYYPYRDDALQVWDAIQNWVDNYVKIYYRDDSEVKNDQDLQNWVNELLSHEGGRVKNISKDGTISTVSSLVEAITMIIFTASAQHAAVNFPQGNIMTYTPAMPLAGYTPAPTRTEDPNPDKSFLNLLPSIESAESQLKLTYLLGSVYYTTLGDYASDFAENSKVKLALEQFQASLKKIEEDIEERNKLHPEFAYTYLMPTRIPQSINI